MAIAKSTKRAALTESPNRLTVGPSLPEEIITEILLRLPVKSLLKFRCVSKSWLKLISSTQFAKTHFQISTNHNIYYHNRLIFGSGPKPSVYCSYSLFPNLNDHNSSALETSVLDYPSNYPDNALRIVGSCKGLVCVALYPSTVILWNPATRKSRELPISDSKGFSYTYGFGYDETNDGYKVFGSHWISTARDPSVYETRVMVYSSRARSWTSVIWPGGKIFDGPGVFVNGSIYWKVYYNDNVKDWVIIAQNVTSEKCTGVELPKIGSDDHVSVILGVSGGFLCASYDYLSYMDIWILKECWSKLVCVPYFFCLRARDQVRPKVLFVSENGGILLNLGSDLILFKPSRYHEMHRLSNHVDVEAATYCESLVSLN